MDLETLSNTDLSDNDKQLLCSYVQNGKPGILKITEAEIFSCFELYMNGKTYREIASITKCKLETILYLSHKAKWHERKMQYYAEISNNMADKITKTKIDSINTITTMASALSKYYNKKFNKFLISNDDKDIEKIDTKLLSQYYKTLETLDKVINNVSGDSKSPSINFNIGSNASVKQVDGNTVDIEVKDDDIKEKHVGMILKALAAAKDEQ